MSRYTPKRWHTRRHRKLFRLGEFAEYGFQVSAAFPSAWLCSRGPRQVDDFLTALSLRELAFDGLSEPVIHGSITSSRHRKSATERDRDFVAELLVYLGFSAVSVGVLQDAWYPPSTSVPPVAPIIPAAAITVRPSLRRQRAEAS